MPVRMGGIIVANDVPLAVLACMLFCSAVLIGTTMLLLLSGLDFVSA